MLLYLSADHVIDSKDIIGIFDLDSATVGKKTRDTLNRAQKEGRVVTVGTDLPKSFTVCAGNDGDQTVYLSELNPATIVRRLSSPLVALELKRKEN